MKKSLFAAALMIAAILFTACNGDKKSAVKSISLKPTELTLNPGGSTRLSLVAEPENAKYNEDDLVWSSSDTTIAVVSANGTVTALEVGTANITVKLGDLTAVCALTVKEWIDDLKFTGVYFGVKDTAAYGEAFDTIQSLDGDSYIVKKIQASVVLFTAGFYLNNEYEFAGSNEGGVVFSEGPIYWAPGWANGSDGGTIFVLGNWFITDRYDPAADSITQVLPCGKTNDQYIPNMKLFMENLLAGDETTAYSVNLADAGEKGCEGSLLTHYQYHTTAEGYPSDGYFSEYVPMLFFDEGYFEAENNYKASSLLCSIEGHHLTAKALREDEVNDTDFFVYGCYWHYDAAGQTYTWVDEDVHFAEKTYTYDYNLDVFNSAPARMRGEDRYMKITNFGDIQTTKKVMKALQSVPADSKGLRK